MQEKIIPDKTAAYINCKGFDGVALDILKNTFSPLLEVTQPFEIHEENANMFVFLETVVIKVQEQLPWISTVSPSYLSACPKIRGPPRGALCLFHPVSLDIPADCDCTPHQHVFPSSFIYQELALD